VCCEGTAASCERHGCGETVGDGRRQGEIATIFTNGKGKNGKIREDLEQLPSISIIFHDLPMIFLTKPY